MVLSCSCHFKGMSLFILIFLLTIIVTSQSDVLAHNSAVRKIIGSSITRADFDQVGRYIADIIAQENRARPYSDNTIVRLLSKQGVHILASSVALHRRSLGIDEDFQRKMAYLKTTISKMVASEDHRYPLSDKAIADVLQKHGFKMSDYNVWAYRSLLGILPDQERGTINKSAALEAKKINIKTAIQEIVANESAPLTDKQIAVELSQQGIEISSATVREYRIELGIPSFSKRGRVETPEKAEAKAIIQELVANESKPLSDKQITAELNQRGIELNGQVVRKYRLELGIPSFRKQERIATSEKAVVKAIIQELVANESTALTDKQITAELNQQGFELKWWTVREYRLELGIPSSNGRGRIETPKKTAAKAIIQELVANESTPLTDKQITAELSKQGIAISPATLRKYRAELGIPPSHKRGWVEEAKAIIQELIANESKTLTDKQITAELNQRGIAISLSTVREYRIELGIPSFSKRGRVETPEKTAAKAIIQELIANESKTLTDKQITAELNQRGIAISSSAVSDYRTELGIPPSRKRGRIETPEKAAAKAIIQELIANESTPLTDKQIWAELNRRGIELSPQIVRKYRIELGIPSSSKRKKEA